jgi:hypothetical protein
VSSPLDITAFKDAASAKAYQENKDRERGGDEQLWPGIVQGLKKEEDDTGAGGVSEKASWAPGSSKVSATEICVKEGKHRQWLAQSPLMNAPWRGSLECCLR